MKLFKGIKNAFTKKPIVKDTVTKNPIVQNSESINYKIETTGEPVIGKMVKDLRIGESAYTVPWCYDINTGEIKMDYSVTEAPRGTSEMLIKRTRKGFTVDFSDLDFEF